MARYTDAMIRTGTPDFPGDWARCQAGEPAPLGALQAPDKFTSYVCMWPEKEYVLGRGSADLHIKGMDAWFPHGGEWGASRNGIRFTMLVDDGKTPGLYSWAKISKLTEMPDLKPVVANGFSPVVVNNILGKGSLSHLSAWTSEGGKEIGHNKETVLQSLVLCQRISRHNTEHGWREIHIHEPLKITQNQVKNECLQTHTQTMENETEKPKQLRLQIRYKSQEGQTWKPDEQEECDLQTEIKSENVVRKLAEADFTLGRVLYSSRMQNIEFSDQELHRTYEVSPHSEMVVNLSVYKQSFQLNCPAMEHIFTKDGKLILKRLINGQWRAVTTNEVKVDITERKLKTSK